jgi:hypothetical protein
MPASTAVPDADRRLIDKPGWSGRHVSYAAAGRGPGAAEENVRRIGCQHVRSTHGPQVLATSAHLRLFHLTDVHDPGSWPADGVGTKVLLGME